MAESVRQVVMMRAARRAGPGGHLGPERGRGLRPAGGLGRGESARESIAQEVHGASKGTVQNWVLALVSINSVCQERAFREQTPRFRLLTPEPPGSSFVGSPRPTDTEDIYRARCVITVITSP